MRRASPAERPARVLYVPLELELTVKNLILPIGLAALLLAACGKDEDRQPAQQTQPTPSATQPAAPATSDVTPPPATSTPPPATTPGTTTTTESESTTTTTDQPQP
jgi:hypothetical protein